MIQPYYKSPPILTLYRSGEISMAVSYAVAGMLTSLTDYSLFFVFFNFINAGLLISTIVAYVGGLIVSFLLSRFWVYKKHAKGQQIVTSAWRYITLLIINLIITYLMLLAIEKWFGLTPLIGKFIVWFFMTFWNYAMNRIWVFKGPRQLSSNFYFAGKKQTKNNHDRRNI